MNANITYTSANPSPVVGDFYNNQAVLGTQEINGKTEPIIIYPNPTNNFVTIKSEYNIISIQLFDVNGKLIKTNRENKKEVVLDISNYPEGVYIAKIETKIGSTIKKIIKK